MMNCITPPPDPTKPPPKRVFVWVCDICRTFKHKDRDVVCAHEEQCARKSKIVPDDNVAYANRNVDDASQAKDKKDKEDNTSQTRKRRSDPQSNNGEDKEPNEKRPQKRDTTTASTANYFHPPAKARNDGKKKDNNISKENNAKSKTQPKSKSTAATASTTDVLSQSSSENSNSSIQAKGTSNNKPMVQLKPPPATGKRKAKSTNVNSKKDTTSLKTTNNNNKKQKAVPTSNKKAKKASFPLASIFQTKQSKAADKALMDEQRAVEFQAERRKQREVERQRKRKRQENFFAASNSSTKTKDVAATTMMPRHHKESKFSCPRFPTPSFVPSNQPSPLDSDNDDAAISKTPATGVTTKATPDQLAKAQNALQKTLPYPGRPILDFCGETTNNDNKQKGATFGWNDNNDNSTLREEWPLSSASEFDRELDKLRRRFGGDTANDQAESNTTTSNSTHHQGSPSTRKLWVDAYSATNNLDDICGAQNKRAAARLVSFVQEWMVHRQQAHDRSAERQKVLQRKHGSKHKTKKQKKMANYCDDDDWWSDDDDMENQLARICLVRGPVGSCKTSLVYAVAKHCDCHVVELNTTDKRGSADLRKVLEEATQSHSSLALLKKKREANLFAKRQPLVDSDDEGDVADSDDEEEGRIKTKKRNISDNDSD